MPATHAVELPDTTAPWELPMPYGAGDQWACTVPDCGQPIESRWLCSKHRRRYERSGTPDGGSWIRPAEAAELDVIRLANAGTKQCVPWPHTILPSGHAAHRPRRGSWIRAVVATWEARHGRHVPRVPLHMTCGDWTCVNPDHLDGRDRPLLEPPGQPGRPPSVTDTQIAEAVILRREGATLYELGEWFEVAPRTIRRLITDANGGRDPRRDGHGYWLAKIRAASRTDITRSDLDWADRLRRLGVPWDEIAIWTGARHDALMAAHRTRATRVGVSDRS
ncbi:MAG: hypothetical protein AAFZ07_19615 [Actinomycetota bacterium]